MGSTDPNPKRAVTIQSYPVGEGQVTSASTVMTAGRASNFEVVVTPYAQTLALWNFFFNFFIDVDDIDHDYWTGSALVAGLRNKIIVVHGNSWASSSDRTNVRVSSYKIINNDTVDHTVYFKFKAYVSTGTGGSFS